MKAILALAVAMTLVAFAHSEDKIVCPPVNDVLVTLLPNPKDCKTYYSCNEGIPTLMPCYPGLEFNAEKKVCDWPEHAKCSIKA